MPNANCLFLGLNRQMGDWLIISSFTNLKLPGKYTNVQKDKKVKDFEKVKEQYAPMISAIIRKLHIYRDYDTFRQVGTIALWQAFLRFDETKGSFTAFAYRSIQGAMLDELKRESRYTDHVTILGDETFEGIEDNYSENELPEWLDRISLATSERLLLEELFIKDRSLAELAAAQRITLAGMKKRRERLLKKIKESFNLQEKG